jgi:hypothetical protein
MSGKISTTALWNLPGASAGSTCRKLPRNRARSSLACVVPPHVTHACTLPWLCGGVGAAPICEAVDELLDDGLRRRGRAHDRKVDRLVLQRLQRWISRADAGTSSQHVPASRGANRASLRAWAGRAFLPWGRTGTSGPAGRRACTAARGTRARSTAASGRRPGRPARCAPPGLGSRPPTTRATAAGPCRRATRATLRRRAEVPYARTPHPLSTLLPARTGAAAHDVRRARHGHVEEILELVHSRAVALLHRARRGVYLSPHVAAPAGAAPLCYRPCTPSTLEYP